MHNKIELINELKKINKIITTRISPESYYRFLVLDSTTGQNTVVQAEMFHKAVNLSGLILTKYDSNAKAGSILTIAKNLQLPIFFIGTGEKMQDFSPFNAQNYITDLLN